MRCLTQLLLAAALGVIVVEGMVALTAPWAFTLSGHFRVIPTWQGWGRLHSATAGDCVLDDAFVQGQRPRRPERYRLGGSLYSARR